MIEEGALWRRIIATKFGVYDSGWFAGGVLRSQWRRLWKKIGDGKERFQTCITWKVGNGTESNFGWIPGLMAVHLVGNILRFSLLPRIKK